MYLGCWVTQIPNQCLVVSDGPWWSSTVTVAPLLASQSHPLVSFVLLQSSFRQSPARALARPSCSRGVLSLFAASAPGVHSHRASRARRRSAHSVSHALDGLLLPVPCAFVSPRCRVQGFASRVCFLHPSRTTSSVAVTLAPLAPLACRLPGASERRVDLRVLLSSRVRGVQRGYSPRRHPSPFLRFQTPSGYSQRPGPCHRTSSARGLVVRCCVCPEP
jgi:hypothetical protein